MHGFDQPYVYTLIFQSIDFTEECTKGGRQYTKGGRQYTKGRRNNTEGRRNYTKGGRQYTKGWGRVLNCMFTLRWLISNVYQPNTCGCRLPPFVNPFVNPLANPKGVRQGVQPNVYSTLADQQCLSAQHMWLPVTPFVKPFVNPLVNPKGVRQFICGWPRPVSSRSAKQPG